MASAVLLIRDAGMPGDNIHILEQYDVTGGALDGSGDPEKGYLIRGGRMHEKHYVCYWDLLSSIPSLEDPSVSVTEESMAFNEKYVSDAKARLLLDGQIMDVSSYGLDARDQADMLKLWFSPESLLGDKRIEDWFSAGFFDTVFWKLWTTMRCPPWRAKRRRVVPGSREATRDTRRAEGAKGDPKGASERGVQSYGRPVCSRNELAMLWRNAG